MNKPFLLITAAAALILFNTTSLAGAYYKWTDENGVTHYTDKPPKDIKANKIDNTKVTPKTHQQAAEEKAAAKDAAALKKIKANCQKAKQRLSTLQSNTTIQTRAADGTLRTLSAEEITEQIRFAKDNVKQVCEGL